MSTQSSSSPAIPFTHTQPQQAFRLLELPSELLELLSSGSAPTLFLKSANPLTTSAPASSAPTPRTKSAESGYVHLCTPTQTYQVRQVSTSNSLFVTQSTKLPHQSSSAPAQNGETDGPQEDEVTLSATGALTTIGQVSSVLELQPVHLDVRALLKGVVPVWRWNDMIMLDMHRKVGRAVSKREFFDQIPAPDGQIEHAWRELFAFQLEGRAYVPDQEMIYRAWKQVMHKFNIDGGLRTVVSAENFLDADSVLEDDLNDGERVLLDLVRNSIWWSALLRGPTGTAMGQDDSAELDRLTTTAWVGKLVLQHMAKGDNSVDAEQFITSWRNLLPEKWDGGVAIDTLDKESYELETNVDGVSMIKWTGRESGRATDAIAKDMGGLESVAKDSKSGTGPVGKKKWHEKFKDSRNVKKVN